MFWSTVGSTLPGSASGSTSFSSSPALDSQLPLSRLSWEPWLHNHYLRREYPVGLIATERKRKSLLDISFNDFMPIILVVTSTSACFLLQVVQHVQSALHPCFTAFFTCRHRLLSLFYRKFLPPFPQQLALPPLFLCCCSLGSSLSNFINLWYFTNHFLERKTGGSECFFSNG